MNLDARRLLRALTSLPELPDLPHAHNVDLPGRGRVHVIDTGSPTTDAPTLLLFHGITATAQLTWFTAIDALRRDHRVVMFDQRWHGRGIVSHQFRLDDCVDDAVAVLDTLGIDTVTAVGYSMGGALAQTFWRRHPTRTDGLLLCSTAMRWQESLGEAAFYPLLGVANNRFRTHHHAKVAQLAATLPDLPTSEQRTARWMWREFRSTSPWALPEVLGELSRFDARPWLGDVAVPTAVVVTGRDHAIPTARQRELARTVPGAREFEAPGGHSSIIFDRDRWLPVFLDAVDDLAGRRTRGAEAVG